MVGDLPQQTVPHASVEIDIRGRQHEHNPAMGCQIPGGTGGDPWSLGIRNYTDSVEGRAVF